MMRGRLNEGEVTKKKGKMAGVRTVSKEENYKIMLSRRDNGKANSLMFELVCRGFVLRGREGGRLRPLTRPVWPTRGG
jgi:hypothetical protein